MLTYSYIQIGLSRSTVICGIYILWKEMTKGKNVCKMLLKRKNKKQAERHCSNSLPAFLPKLPSQRSQVSAVTLSSKNYAPSLHFVLRAGVQLINNAGRVSGGQHRASAMHVQVSLLPRAPQSRCHVTLGRGPWAYRRSCCSSTCTQCVHTHRELPSCPPPVLAPATAPP